MRCDWTIPISPPILIIFEKGKCVKYMDLQQISLNLEEERDPSINMALLFIHWLRNMPILRSEPTTQHMPHIDQPIDGRHRKKLTVLGSAEGRE